MNEKELELLTKSQGIALRSFSNSLSNGRLAHAYLLSGEEGTPLLEMAIYMAKSILCDNPSPLADLTCRTCKRIDEGNYPDLVILNGEDETLKKEAINDLLELFSKTPLEKKGKLIYIIHHAEALTIEAENALLKFLEEPNPDVIAILTSSNITKLLPTIISRCEVLRLVLPEANLVFDEAISLGVDQEDAFLLCKHYGSGSSIKEHASKDTYISAKKAFKSYLNAIKDEDDIVYLYQCKIGPLLKEKEVALEYLTLLSDYAKHQLDLKLSKDVPVLAYHIYTQDTHLSDPLELIYLIDEVKGAIASNVATALALDHLAYNTIKLWTK